MAIINGVGRFGVRSYVAPVSLSSIVTNGLVLSLDASNPLSYSGSGTTWTDLTGNGNNGTLTNGTSYSSANGGTLTFDGINDYVDTNLITNQSAFTYGVWAKSSTSGFTNRIMGNADSTTGYNGADIIWGALGSNTIYSVRRGGGNFDIFTSNIANFSGNWHYIVLTYDSVNGSKLYCDNVLVASKANVGLASTLKLRIGKDGDGADAFNGSVGAVQVYNKALSSAEVEQNFNASKSRFGFVSYTTRTAAFATATGITDATILNALNTFDTGLISNGLATKMNALYPFVGGTANTHKFNFMNAQDTDAAFRLTFNGGWIHSSTGALPNGTNAFANTFFNPANEASVSTTNMSISTYLRNNNSGIGDIGSYLNTGNGIAIIAKYPGENNAYYRCNNGFDVTVAGQSTAIGLNLVSTISSGLRKYFKNNTIINTNADTTSSNKLSINVDIGRVASYYSGRQTSLASIGQGLSDAEALTFYNLVQALQTSLGRQV